MLIDETPNETDNHNSRKRTFSQSENGRNAEINAEYQGYLKGTYQLTRGTRIGLGDPKIVSFIIR